MNFNPLEFTEEEYESLLSSGMGAKIYGDSFPLNIQAYRNLLTKADAQLELWKYVTHFVQHTEASPTDLVKAMLTCTVNTDTLKRAFKQGLLTSQDVADMEDELDE